MSDFLERMAESSRARVATARRREPEPALLARAEAAPPPLPLTLAGFDLIAELKLRSPAAGALARGDLDHRAQVEAYARGGAAAVSVLTEPTEFHGDLAHLSSAAESLRPLGCPVMRKDFLTDPYQVIEARASGASGVLLIVTMLEDARLEDLIASARGLGLFVLLEGFDAADLERIGALAPPPAGPAVLAGVNCRDLKTLAVDFERFAGLAAQLPPGLPAVAESGVDSASDIARLAELGYALALVGSALMRSADTAAAVADFVGAGRGALWSAG